MEKPELFDFYNYEYMDLGVGLVPNEDLFKYYVEFSRTTNASRILELGYGTGRLTMGLLKNGFDVVAIDKSDKGRVFLEKRYEADEPSNSLIIEQADILEYNSKDKFDLIVAADEFILHFLTIEELGTFMKIIGSLLNNEGVLIVDLRKQDRKQQGKIFKCPLYSFLKETNGVKFIQCSTWSEVKDNDVIWVYFKYEEMDSQMKLKNSYLKVLRHGRFQLNQIVSIADRCGMSLDIDKLAVPDFDMLIFKKRKN